MRPRGYFTDPFTDLLFNILLGFTFLFLVSIMFMNPIAKLGNVNLKAEYMITVTWPDNRPDDVDIWVQDPQGQTVSYLTKDAGWLHLDRDDQGNIKDTVMLEGKPVVYPVNEEIVTVRGIIAGEYTVNIFYYEDRSDEPLPVEIKITKINPSLTLVFLEQVELTEVNQEITVVRFTLGGDGSFISVNRNPKILTPYNNEEPAIL